LFIVSKKYILHLKKYDAHIRAVKNVNYNILTSFSFIVYETFDSTTYYIIIDCDSRYNHFNNRTNLLSWFLWVWLGNRAGIAFDRRTQLTYCYHTILPSKLHNLISIEKFWRHTESRINGGRK
jgi:hypothetical protein